MSRFYDFLEVSTNYFRNPKNKNTLCKKLVLEILYCTRYERVLRIFIVNLLLRYTVQKKNVWY